MEDKNKTKEQLMDELEKSRCRIAELEALETKRVKGELRMKAAFDVVRSSVHEMRESGDMKDVLASLYEALKEIGIDFENCSIQIIDEKFKGFGILWRGLYRGQHKLHFMGSDREYPVNRTSVTNNAVYEAWRNKRPIYRRDLKAEDPYDELADIKKSYSVDIRSILDVPFSHGTIAINSMQPNAFSETDIQMLKQFAEILSEAHSWLENITKRERAEEMARIQRDLGMILSVTDSLDEILRLCVEAAINGTEMDCGGIYLVNKASGALDLAFQKGLSPEFVKNASHYDADSLNARLVMTGEPVYAQYETMDVDIGESDHREELRAAAIIPVYHEGQAIACLNIASHTLDDVPTTARHMLETIAAQIGSVIARIQVEKELQESEEKYRVLVENANEAILVAQDGTLKFANPKTVELIGHSEEELTSRPFLDFIHPDDQEMVVERYLKRLRGEEVPHTYSFRIVDGDGNTKWVDINAVLIDWMGKPATLNFLADIAERRQMEERIQQQNEFLNTILRSLTHPFYVIDVHDYTIKLANSAAGLGDLSEDKTCYALTHKSDEPCGSMEHPCPIEEIKKTKRAITVEHIHYDEDGNPRNVEVHGYPIFDSAGNVVQIIEYCLDITERKKMEEVLKESEEKYRVLVENANEGISVAQDGMLKFVNPKLVELAGHSEEELISRPFADFIHPDDREMLSERYLKRLRGEGVPHTYPYRIVDEDGNAKWMEISSTLITWDGRPATLNFLNDITERKEAEKALRESEEKYKGLFDNSMDAIYIHDMEGRFLDANQAALDMLGYTKEEISGLSIASIIDEDQLPRALNSIKDLLAGKHNMQEYVMTGKNGRTVNVEVLGSVVYDRDGKPSAIQGIARDISERKQLEQELLRIEKLESVGILAGGIAHDFNNILTAILGNISLARMYTDPDKISERLAEAEKASIRAGSLTQQLLTFSRGGAPIKTISSIAGILKDSTAFALSGSNVKFEFSVPDDLWAVEIDEGQISQVINNLIINADQAMPGGGTIKVQTENVTVGVEDILPLEDGEYVRISIKDQGIGMSDELLQKIFDPYVTTKQKGSGLGLATCYSIISNHDGYITAESQVEVGSTFHIYLPASPKEILPRNREVEEKPTMGAGRILVIDDDDMVRELVSDMLENIGYEAALAIDGAQAIEIYRNARESGYPFDAVIVDLTIPGGMGGKEAIQKLKEIDPEIKAVVSSGYSTDPVMANFREYGFSDVIAKPYRSKELSEVLYRVTNDK